MTNDRRLIEDYLPIEAISRKASRDESDDGKVRIVVEGQKATGYEANWFRNAVWEPLDEADIEELDIE